MPASFVMATDEVKRELITHICINVNPYAMIPVPAINSDPFQWGNVISACRNATKDQVKDYYLEIEKRELK